jgi:3-oxoadipate enol-lactonase
MTERSQPTPFVVPGGPATLDGELVGAGRDLLLLHGLSAARRQVLQGSRHLLRRGCRLLSYDARGHGRSSPAPEPADYEYADLVDDLRRVIAQLDLDGPLVLVGSSMGAATAMAYALAEPERIAALVQITPGYDGAPKREEAELSMWDRMSAAVRAGDIEGFAVATGDSRLPEKWQKTVRTAIQQRMEQHLHLDAVADALRVVPRSAAWDGLDVLAGVTVPTLVVGSRDEVDPMHPLALARDYAERLPDARLAVEDKGESPLAWRGTALSQAIGDFLEDL